MLSFFFGNKESLFTTVSFFFFHKPTAGDHSSKPLLSQTLPASHWKQFLPTSIRLSSRGEKEILHLNPSPSPTAISLLFLHIKSNT